MAQQEELRSPSPIFLRELDHTLRTSNGNLTRRDQGARLDDTQDQAQYQESSEPCGVTPAVSAANTGDVSSVNPERGSSWHNFTAHIKEIWSSNVSCEVEHSACRDHLALERTFLGYLRTSMMMSIIGTTIAQLFTINHHDAGFGYTLVGKPFATVCYAFSIGTILLGAERCWRQQHAMICGRALSSGFEIHVMGIGVALLLIVFFGFMIAIDVVKVTSPEADLEG